MLISHLFHICRFYDGSFVPHIISDIANYRSNIFVIISTQSRHCICIGFSINWSGQSVKKDFYKFFRISINILYTCQRWCWHITSTYGYTFSIGTMTNCTELFINRGSLK
ncbi:hypothetical protein D3C87_1905310 [compost metagenome]